MRIIYQFGTHYCQRWHLKSGLPFLISYGMEHRYISLDGDGDSHEDATTEQDVMEGVEEVWEEVMMNMSE